MSLAAVNPLVWLHLRMSGSLRQNLAIIAIFLALVIAGRTVSFRALAPGEEEVVDWVWLGLLTSAQAAFLLLLAPGAIRRAVLRDFQTAMMDSHRLTPMSSARIIAGYMLGPPLQAFMLYGTSLAVGAYLAFRVGIGGGAPAAVMGAWCSAQVCLLMLAFLIASLVLLTALATQGKANLTIIIVLVTAFGGWALVAVVPGLALLGGLTSGALLLELVTRPGAASGLAAIPAAAAAQLAIGLLCLVAAARKVRRPAEPAFSLSLGLVLALAWGVTLWAGLSAALVGAMVLPTEASRSAQIIGSLLAFLLVAEIPLLAGAFQLHRLDRLRRFGHRTSASAHGWALAGPAILTALAMALLAVLVYEVEQARQRAFADLRPAIVLAVCAAVALSLWTDFGVAYAATALSRAPVMSLLVVAALLKVGPGAGDLLVAVGREVLGSGEAEAEMLLSWGSPLGTIIGAGLLSAPGGPGAPEVSVPRAWPRLWAGLGAQGVIALLITWLAWRQRWGVVTRAAPAGAAGRAAIRGEQGDEGRGV